VGDITRDERYRELVRASGLPDFSQLAPSSRRTLDRLAGDDDAVAATLDLLRAVRSADAVDGLTFRPHVPAAVRRAPRPPDLLGSSGP